MRNVKKNQNAMAETASTRRVTPLTAAAPLPVVMPQEPTADSLERAQDCQERLNQSALYALRIYRYDRVVEAEKRRALQLSLVCADCQQDIDPERLRVEPSATRCIVCQAKYARRNLRFGSREKFHSFH